MKIKTLISFNYIYDPLPLFPYNYYRVFSLTWATSMQIYWNERKRLHKKRVQLPKDWSGTPTWPLFHCFGTPIWPPWCHVKTLCYRDPWKSDDLMIHNQAKCPISSASIAALMSLRVLSWLHCKHTLSNNVKTAMLLTSYFLFLSCNLKFLGVLEKKNKLNLASLMVEKKQSSRVDWHPSLPCTVIWVE